MDIYEISGNEKALEIVKGMGNWVYARLESVAKGDTYQHVEQIHCRRVWGNERSYGKTVPDDQ